MSKIDRDLAAALKQAKTKPMNFALVMKAPGEGTLIVSKNKVPSQAIADAKKQIGGGQLIKGRCVGNSAGELIFETPGDPPAVLIKTLKAVIRRDAGLTLPLDARKGSQVEDDSDQDADDASSSNANGPASADKEAIRKRLTTLAAQFAKIQKSAVARGPDANALRTEFEKAKTLIAKQDWPGAAKSLDEVDRLTTRAITGDVLYQLGYKEGEEHLGAKSRAAVAKRQEFAQLVHYYDEGFGAGQSAPVIAVDPLPQNNGPTMGPNRMTKKQEERGREIDEANKELRRVLSGQGDGPEPHIDPVPPEITTGD